MTGNDDRIITEEKLKEKEIDILQERHKQLWDEIMYRRGVEDKTVVWITGIMLLIAGGVLTHPITSLVIKGILVFGVLVIFNICRQFIWENHSRHNDVAKIIVKIETLFGLFKDDLYCKDSLYPEKFKNFGNANWGTKARIKLMLFATLICIAITIISGKVIEWGELCQMLQLTGKK